MKEHRCILSEKPDALDGAMEWLQSEISRMEDNKKEKITSALEEDVQPLVLEIARKRVGELAAAEDGGVEGWVVKIRKGSIIPVDVVYTISAVEIIYQFNVCAAEYAETLRALLVLRCDSIAGKPIVCSIRTGKIFGR